MIFFYGRSESLKKDTVDLVKVLMANCYPGFFQSGNICTPCPRGAFEPNFNSTSCSLVPIGEKWFSNSVVLFLIAHFICC